MQKATNKPTQDTAAGLQLLLPRFDLLGLGLHQALVGLRCVSSPASDSGGICQGRKVDTGSTVQLSQPRSDCSMFRSSQSVGEFLQSWILHVGDWQRPRCGSWISEKPRFAHLQAKVPPFCTRKPVGFLIPENKYGRWRAPSGLRSPASGDLSAGRRNHPGQPARFVRRPLQQAKMCPEHSEGPKGLVYSGQKKRRER